MNIQTHNANRMEIAYCASMAKQFSNTSKPSEFHSSVFSWSFSWGYETVCRYLHNRKCGYGVRMKNYKTVDEPTAERTI